MPQRSSQALSRCCSGLTNSCKSLGVGDLCPVNGKFYSDGGGALGLPASTAALPMGRSWRWSSSGVWLSHALGVFLLW